MSILINIIQHYAYKRLFYRISTKSTKSDDPKINNIVEELKKTGICVLHNFIDKKVIKNIKNEINQSISNLEIINNSKIYNFENQGIKRYLNAEKFSVTANKFFFNSFFNKIATHYVSKNVKAYQKMFEIKGAVGKFATTDIFHFDDWRKRFKIFLYLNNVDKNNCPFCFIPKSIKIDKKRALKELEYIALGKSGSYGYYLEHEMDNLKKRNNFKELLVTGDAGTVILVDTRGLHKGSPSIDGNKRELLATYYDIR